MNSEPGIILKKPDQWLGKMFKVKVDKGNVGKFIGKVLIDVITSDAKNAFKDCVDFAAAIGIAQEPGEIAWTLIYSALTQAMANLVEDNQDLFQLANQGNEINTDEIQFSQCLERLETEEITIYQDFFQRPQNFYIVTEIKTPFADFLQTTFNFNPAQAQAISNRLPDEFLDALYTEAAKHSEKYSRLQTQFNNLFNLPAEQKAQQKLAWRRYSAWLQKQVTERIFAEPFGLKQVYVDLRAYYEEKIDNQDYNDQREDKNIKRIVVNLEEELQTWLDEANKNDAIRLISGDPGSGKSSFAKMFAAKQAEKGEIPVLFIPLHLLVTKEKDLDGYIDYFINSIPDIPLPPNPLKKENVLEQLLIIFDGLDELAMQGKVAEEVAQDFIDIVMNKVKALNTKQTRLQVLIIGRGIIVQKNKSYFQKPKQVLNLIPYFVDEKARRKYIDDNHLLDTDQRNTWWQKYGEAKGSGYTQLPTELDQGKLREIIAQPLLNYLVALSYEAKEIKFTADSNLNEIYEDLLNQIYKRVWSDNYDPDNPDNPDNLHIRGVEEKDFVEMLEVIAIAAWRSGEIRATKVSEVKKYCNDITINRILNIFKDEKASFTRLFTAFYFRQREENSPDEETFEFTHKSFSEYLAARGVVRQLAITHQELQQNKIDFGKALENWAKICGATAIDEYIFDFVVNEIRWQQDKYNVDVCKWQQTMCNLISYMLKDGMPMEKLGIETFQKANRQARNAEAALLVVLNACARVTKKLSQIKWHSSIKENTEEGEKEYFTDFGNWISRLRSQRVNYNRVFCLNFLSYLDLQHCIITAQDLLRANLQGANLQSVNLQGANLQGANLQSANLQGANLQSANLQGANLQGTNLQSARLESANLQSAKLQSANLESANLQLANLQLANLESANLKEANLESANLQLANLQWANLQLANLQLANLQLANLQLANLESAKLQSANLQSANLQLANLQWAKLQSANLQSVKLQSANLQSVKLQSANLQSVNLQSAKLQSAKLQSANLEWANLEWANLQSAKLQSAKLQSAKLQSANLQSANLQVAIIEWPRLLPANFEPEDSE